jgi:SAM-dependent methyltransferase
VKGEALTRAAMDVVLASGRLRGRMGRLMRAVLNGVLLGLLSDRRLKAMGLLYHAREGIYTTSDWNERGLAWWERDAIVGSFAPGSRVLVVGCGGGREVLGLINAGFEAVGCDPNRVLQEFAAALLARHGHPGRTRTCAADSFPAGERCDGILIGWGTYSLLAPRRARVALLRDALAATDQQGSIVLSCFARPAHGRELRITDAVARAIRRRPAVSIELGDTLAPARVHVFTRLELEGELRDAGLELVSYRAFMAADETTSYVCAIGSADGT